MHTSVKPNCDSNRRHNRNSKHNRNVTHAYISNSINSDGNSDRDSESDIHSNKNNDYVLSLYHSIHLWHKAEG